MNIVFSARQVGGRGGGGNVSHGGAVVAMVMLCFLSCFASLSLSQRGPPPPPPPPHTVGSVEERKGWPEKSVCLCHLSWVWGLNPAPLCVCAMPNETTRVDLPPPPPPTGEEGGSKVRAPRFSASVVSVCVYRGGEGGGWPPSF